MTNCLVMLFTDGKIFVGDVSRCLQLPAHLAFHTPRVEVRLVHLYVVIRDLELANSTFVNCLFVTLCTRWLVLPGEVFLAQLCVAEPTSEASLMVESSHGEEPVVSERLLTRGAHLARPTVTNHLGLPVAKLGKHLATQTRRLKRSRVWSRSSA